MAQRHDNRTLVATHLASPLRIWERTSGCKAIQTCKPTPQENPSHVSPTDHLCKRLPQTSQNSENSHQDRFVAKRTVHRRAWPWCWLQVAWANISNFVWRGSDLESVEPRESRRPLTEGVPCPPPHRKNQDTNVPAARGVSRFFLSGHPPKL